MGENFAFCSGLSKGKKPVEIFLERGYKSYLISGYEAGQVSNSIICRIKSSSACVCLLMSCISVIVGDF